MPCSHDRFNSWDEYDRKGTPIGRVCRVCYLSVLKRYKQSQLTDRQKVAILVPESTSYTCMGCGCQTKEADKVCRSCKAVLAGVET